MIIEQKDVMEKVELFVPGRLCLFGEHSDWAGRYTDVNAAVPTGMAIVAGIDLGIYATATKRHNFVMSSFTATGEPVQIVSPATVQALQVKAQRDQYFAYACGTAAYMLAHYPVGGLQIDVTKITLPIKKGLASSAAICVLVVEAFNQLYQLHLDASAKMRAAYRGEMLCGSRCGRLDQACVYGRHPVCMQFDGEEITASPLKVGRELSWVLADLQGHKDTKKILADLHKAYPFAQTAAEKSLHTALGADNQALVQQAIAALAAGDAQQIGQLMRQAQQIFDQKIAPHCPTELTAPKLHQILNDPQVQALSCGGKGVGSQGDGMVQLITPDPTTQQQLVQYLQSLGLVAYAFTLPATPVVTKAIIPLAGYGTRLYPATRFVKKEFLPLIDPQGVVKPVLLYLLEELAAAGIDTIILVVGHDELPFFKKMLQTPIPTEYFAKLPPAAQQYEQRLAQLSKKIKLVTQTTRRGFGDAVYQAWPYVPNEPVLLLLGDFVYRSQLAASCTTQMLQAYQQSNGQTLVAIKPVPLADVSHYGILTGEFMPHQPNLLTVKSMWEKPDQTFAQAQLGVKTRGQTNYYATFGQYILTPTVFQHLAQAITAQAECGGSDEIQLTDALQKTLASEGLTGVVLQGQSYDVGIPSAYQAALAQFSAPEPKA